MPQLFAVVRTRDPSWNDSVPMDEQVDGRCHAARPADHCWSVKSLLRTLRIKPWWLPLGTLHS